jgi:hypothetical protein
MIELSLEQGLLLACGLVMPVVGLVARRAWLRQKLNLETVRGELSRLQTNHEALNQSLMGMGKRMKLMTTRLAEAEQRAVLTPVEEASFQQAARLVSLGATARDLVDNCGMGRAEAELMVSMRRRHG